LTCSFFLFVFQVWAERYDNKCDVFSCGVLLYVLLCLYTPFDGDDDNDILRKVMRGKFAFPVEEWGCVSEEAKDFVKKLMSKYPRRRPSAKEALEHEWFAKALGTAAGSEGGSGGGGKSGGVGVEEGQGAVGEATKALLPPPPPPVEGGTSAETGADSSIEQEAEAM
jgi:hypothetical protein